MMLSAAEIDTSIHWLLENASPPVKYLTHKRILNADPQSHSMRELWRDVQGSSEADEIWSRQNEDGSWFCGGPWGPRGYRRQTGRGYTSSRPKYVTTAWILPYLGEMGFTVADERIRHSCEDMLQEMGMQSDPPDPPRVEAARAANCCGLYAIPLRAFASVGMAADQRLRGAWDWLTRCQRTDGGWLNPNHLADSPTPSRTEGRWPWDRSCVWGSFYAVQALFYAQTEAARRALPDALGFLRWHLLQQDPQQVRTWVYHGHNTVKELLIFGAAGYDLCQAPFSGLLEWLRGYYRPSEGVFRTQEKPIPNYVRQISAIRRAFEEQHGADYWRTIAKTSAPVLRYHLYHLVEEDWLTYYLTRIALNMIPRETREEVSG